MTFKNKNMVGERPFFTHFANLPFIEPEYRSQIQDLQASMRKLMEVHPKFQQPESLR